MCQIAKSFLAIRFLSTVFSIRDDLPPGFTGRLIREGARTIALLHFLMATNTAVPLLSFSYVNFQLFVARFLPPRVSRPSLAARPRRSQGRLWFRPPSIGQAIEPSSHSLLLLSSACRSNRTGVGDNGYLIFVITT